jgi:hypothetical protein
MATPRTLVCPRCGEAAGEQRFCGQCGLNIAAQDELPTRAEWEARAAGAPASTPAAGTSPRTPAVGATASGAPGPTISPSEAAQLFVRGRRVVAVFAALCYVVPALPFYGIAGVDDSLWGDRAGLAAVMTLMAFFLTVVVLISVFRTPNTFPNVSPVLAGFGMAAAVVAGGAAIGSLSPPSGLSLEGGAIGALVVAGGAVVGAAMMWRGATLGAQAVTHIPVAAEKCIRCNAPIVSGLWCGACDSTLGSARLDPALEPALATYLSAVITGYERGSVTTFAEAYTPDAIVHPPDAPSGVAIGRFIDERREAFEALAGATAKAPVAFRDGSKYWVRWEVLLPSGQLSRSVSAITLRGTLVGESRGWLER